MRIGELHLAGTRNSRRDDDRPRSTQVTLPGGLAARNRSYLPWLGLVCICAAFVAAVVHIHPANLFGLTHDDSIYFSSAKAIAEGKGYVLPSFPGTPAATKYPEFYPWILSWVWRWNPSFPANLADAIAVNVAFGIFFITAIFLFMRGLTGMGDRDALILTAFCALHPEIVFYAGCLLSDLPFAAFALTAIVIIEKAARQEGGDRLLSIASGISAGLGMLTRALGAPVAAGIVVALMLRRAWHQTVLFCGSLAPFLGVTVWRFLLSRPARSTISGEAAKSLGWIQTWSYYTSYVGDWKHGVPSFAIFAAMLRDNAISFLRAPAEYFVLRSPEASAVLLAGLIGFVTLLLVKGIIRLVRGLRLRCFHWVLTFYLLTAVLWNYALASRFLILFLPLFAAAVWVEGKEILNLLRRTLREHPPVGERVVAAALALVIVFIAGWSARSQARMWRVASERSRGRGSLLPDKQSAYAWMARSTEPNTRLVAYEDAVLYLYTSRQAVRPVTFPTLVAYNPEALTMVLEHTLDVARAIDADYWLISDDDYLYEWGEAHRGYQVRVNELEKTLPPAFSSKSGRVKIYRLGCVQNAVSLCPGTQADFPYLFGHGGRN